MANLTLSLEDDLLKQARIYAIHHDTSVNSMVRDYLRSVVAEVDDAARAERLQALANIDRLAKQIEAEGLITGDWKWNRDEVYEDRFARWDSK